MWKQSILYYQPRVGLLLRAEALVEDQSQHAGVAADKRKQAHEELGELFQRIESLGWGVLLPANESGCQVFKKTALDSLSPQAKKELEKANVPALFFRPFPPTVLQSKTSCMSSADPETFL